MHNNRNTTHTYDSQEDNLSFLFGDKTVSKSILDDPFIVLKEDKKNKKFKLNDALLSTISSVEKQAKKEKYSYTIVGIFLLSFTIGIVGLKTSGSFDKSSLNENNFRTSSSTMTKIVSQNINFKTKDIKSKIQANEIYSDDEYFMNYNLKDNDSISKISKNFNTQPEVLRIINNLESDNDIKKKENIIVPVVDTTIHKVQSNESLGTIAESYKVSLDDIVAMNKTSVENPHMIQIGQPIVVPTSEISKHTQKAAKSISKPSKISKVEAPKKLETKYDRTNSFVHKLSSGENLDILAKRYSLSVEKILAANNISDPTRLQINQPIIIPGTKVVSDRNAYRNRNVRVASRSLMSYGTSSQVQTGRMVWPAPGGYVTSGYGWRGNHFHQGIDIVNASSYYGAIVSSMSGTVTFAGWDAGGYGYTVVVSHGNGLRTKYAHCSSLNVYAGQYVQAGTKIANIGSTGYVTGPHLHFEVFANGIAVNPRNYL